MRRHVAKNCWVDRAFVALSQTFGAGVQVLWRSFKYVVVANRTRECGGFIRMDDAEDRMNRIATAGFDIAIMTLICVTLLSGRPAFETSKATVDPPAPASLAPDR